MHPYRLQRPLPRPRPLEALTLGEIADLSLAFAFGDFGLAFAFGDFGLAFAFGDLGLRLLALRFTPFRDALRRGVGVGGPSFFPNVSARTFAQFAAEGLSDTLWPRVACSRHIQSTAAHRASTSVLPVKPPHDTLVLQWTLLQPL